MLVTSSPVSPFDVVKAYLPSPTRPTGQRDSGTAGGESSQAEKRQRAFTRGAVRAPGSERTSLYCRLL